MHLLCGAMGRGRKEEEEERQRATVSRRGRWIDGEQRPSAAGAGRAGWRCRSCAAVAIADCVALGCCPCAVVTLLGLVLVKAPLALGRRLRRRNRRSPLLRRKQVRDVAASSTARDKQVARAATAAGGGTTMLDPANDDHATVGAAAAAVHHDQQQTQAEVTEEPAWLDEMYRVGHWGFGHRVSFSGSAPGKTP